MLPDANLCTWCMNVHLMWGQTKPKCWSLEERKVCCRAMQGDGSCLKNSWAPQKLSAKPFPRKDEEGEWLVVANFLVSDPFFKLGLTCVSMLLVSAMQKSESAVHISLLFFGFPSHLGHHRAVSRVPCAHSRFSLVICFKPSRVYMSTPISKFIPPPLPSLVSVHLFSTSVSLFLRWKYLYHFSRFYIHA